MNLAALKQYLPAFGMALVVVLQALYSALEDSAISAEEAVTLVIALLGAFTTYFIPRLPGRLQWLKTAASGLTAGFTALLASLVGTVTPQEWVTIGLAILGAIGVAATTKYVPLAVPREMTGPVSAPVVVHAERGHVDLGLVVAVALIVLIVVLLFTVL